MSDEHRPTRPGIPFVVIALGAAFVGAYLLYLMLSPGQQNEVVNAYALIPVRFDSDSPDHFTTWYGPLGALFGHVFLHAGWLHLGMNTFGYLPGRALGRDALGRSALLILFFLSALGGAAAFILVNAHSENWAVGASGAICGVFGAYFLSVRRSWREALADMQVRGAIGSFLFINVLLAGIASATGFLPIAWEAHLGGFVAGALAYLVLAPRFAPRGPRG